MKVAYIAHPIGGDVTTNMFRIIKIVTEINLNEPDVVPFAPYYADCLALNDNVPEERERGIKNDMHLLRSGIVDEVRLYGNRISPGMKAEMDLAQSLGIPVIAMTVATDRELNQ